MKNSAYEVFCQANIKIRNTLCICNAVYRYFDEAGVCSLNSLGIENTILKTLFFIWSRFVLSYLIPM